FFSSRRRHTRWPRDWSSDVCSSDLIGPYRLEATLPGFRSFVQSGIVLQVNSSPVINLVLEVGQVSEQVEVQANAALVETRSSSRSEERRVGKECRDQWWT